MAINTDGQKKIGRFLKKGSRLLSHMSMVDFDFDEIASHTPVGYDNPDRSIINTRFHDPSEISARVKTPDSIEAQLDDISKPRRGIIFPADFTQDWYNERSNKKRKKSASDDEDEDTIFEGPGLVTNETSDSNVKRFDATVTDNKSDENSLGVGAAEKPSTIVAHPISPENVRNADTANASKRLNERDLSAAISKAFTPPAQQDQPAVADSSHRDSFTPFPVEGADAPVAAEDKAIETWKAQQQLAQQNERMLEELKTQSRSEGYQSGFREGEEKGLISGQKKAAQVFQKVDEIIKEFEGLKSLVLENVQKNFYELSQAIAESLLGREFSIRPEAYAAMIERVIKDTISPNEFKVKMHPETWQRVHDLGIKDLNPHLIKDQSIPVGEFRVESALTVVDVSVKKLVQQLLEKADITLFDNKKVG